MKKDKTIYEIPLNTFMPMLTVLHLPNDETTGFAVEDREKWEYNQEKYVKIETYTMALDDRQNFELIPCPEITSLLRLSEAELDQYNEELPSPTLLCPKLE